MNVESHQFRQFCSLNKTEDKRSPTQTNTAEDYAQGKAGDAGAQANEAGQSAHGEHLRKVPDG